MCNHICVVDSDGAIMGLRCKNSDKDVGKCVGEGIEFETYSEVSQAKESGWQIDSELKVIICPECLE